MKVTAQQLINFNSPHVTYVTGDLAAEAYRPWPPDVAPPGGLVYVSTRPQLESALEGGAGLVIALKSATLPTPQTKPLQAVFATSSLKAAMALINPQFDQKTLRWPPGVSEQVSIAPTARIGAGVSIGAFCVIGDSVEIGDGASISPHCVIEKGARVGASTRLHPFVYVGADCEIGARCEIHSHTAIGSDGFGYVTEPGPGSLNTHHKVPQLGRVVIEDDVEIGANCSIDRATLDVTRIGQGSKIDNLCQIAHNCIIGKNALIASGFGMAGSSTLGDNFTAAGNVAIVDHIQITNNVLIGGRSAVTKDVPVSGAYTGYPLQPWRDGLKTLATQTILPEIRKELLEIRKNLKLAPFNVKRPE